MEPPRPEEEVRPPGHQPLAVRLLHKGLTHTEVVVPQALPGDRQE